MILRLRQTEFQAIPGLLLALLVGASPTGSYGQQWETISELPEPRAGAATVHLDGHVYVIGGRSHRERATSTVYRYNPTTNEWSGADNVSHLDEPRTNAAAVVLGRKIFVIGGRNESGEVLQSVEVYDPDLNEWRDFPDTKRQREGAAAIILGDRLLLIGGSDQGERALETVELFDVANDRWEEINEWRLDRPRVSSAAAVLNGSVYIFGGFNTFGPVGQVQQYNSFSGSVASTDMPLARGALAATVVGRSIYVIGGRSKDRVLDVTQIFTPDSQTWADAAALNTPRFSFSAATVGRTIYVFGGLGGQNVPLASVEKLGPITTATDPAELPPDVALKSPFPNPFERDTQFEYSVSLSEAGRVSMEVVDVTGRVVRTFRNAPSTPGVHRVTWSGETDTGASAASGLYFLRMTQGPYQIVRKVVRVAG